MYVYIHENKFQRAILAKRYTKIAFNAPFWSKGVRDLIWTKDGQKMEKWI